MKKLLVALLAGATLMQPIALYADLPDLGEISDTSLTLADEARIGRDAMRALREEGAIIDDTEINTYLQAIGGRMASGAKIPNLHFTFFGVNDYGINAFAMPGGYIGVNAGLILTSQSEGELASVIGHEMAHVTQRHIARAQAANFPNQLIMLATIAAAVLASRAGGGQAAAGAVNAGMGLAMSNQLAFSRDFEREADRVGMQYLSAGGFDVRNMPQFFERMQQVNRFNDNNAYAFLRTHPVTGERISEAQNRAEGYPVKMKPDSTDYLLVREKLRLGNMEGQDAIKYYEAALQRRLFLSEGAVWYGMARARLAGHDTAGARQALSEARRLLPPDPMLFTLEADIDRESGKLSAALVAYRQGLAAFPDNPALMQGELAALIDTGDRVTALAKVRTRLDRFPADSELYRLQARLYSEKDALRYHAALGNAYYFDRRFEAALEQYHLAAKAPGEDFYLRSSIEARTRELEKMLKDEKNKAK
ncbi:M48 family metalloprotease [Paludibacterium paludis]|uniref:Exported protein n=1 Tax=Paludibacterium paludis TaxID=1225769 RepID=A0A918P301_9NEIS|nr:M48 family metalloprotease [Paludibacterium paludis]GGY15858.1 exported protein [Paludibacterium paludis]